LKSIKIDRSRHLCDEPKTGHNRRHPDIQPIVEVEQGEEVTLETRDAVDCYLTEDSTEADFATLAFGAIHLLMGPVWVKGATPFPALLQIAVQISFSSENTASKL